MWCNEHCVQIKKLAFCITVTDTAESVSIKSHSIVYKSNRIWFVCCKLMKMKVPEQHLLPTVLWHHVVLCKQSQLSGYSFRQSFIVEVVNRNQITVNKISKEYSGHRYVVFEKAVKKFCQTDPVAYNIHAQLTLLKILNWLKRWH